MDIVILKQSEAERTGPVQITRKRYIFIIVFVILDSHTQASVQRNK